MKALDIVISIILGFLLCIVALWSQILNEEVEVSGIISIPSIDTLVQSVHFNYLEGTVSKVKYYPKYVVNVNVPLSAELQIHAQQVCDRYDVGYAFFLAMCESESSFKPEALGDSGASRGLMQINKCNWEKYGLDASMVYDNIEIGIRMMAELIEKYEAFDHIVMAYKGGESFADEWIAQERRLDCCDTLADRVEYWQNIIDEGLVLE